MSATYGVDLQCFSVSSGGREELEYTGKILLPPTLLNTLSRRNISYPMLFRLTNQQTGRHTHCGVLEFLADEGTTYLPSWIMQHLSLLPGATVRVDCVSLSVATYSRFQPQSVHFLDISNPKAVLENSLRTFACLTKGDIFQIHYNRRTYEILVEETRPGDAVSIIECDMEVDFSAPVGYTSPTAPAEGTGEEPAPVQSQAPPRFRAFSGEGNRLDGKTCKVKSLERCTNEDSEECEVGVPDYDYRIGSLSFNRECRSVKSQSETKAQPQFRVFSGVGRSLDSNNNTDSINQTGSENPSP